ncbi:hypothetical protein VNG_0811H [Halobacterium salinarum NRC-1]|uniref:Uncharacterized protein n=5 Tax=Halobacterium salinarum TaxID=2242 RepID=Q9HR89_HALSA|nr:hypothetical protein VNG_0811H [Halobacterium salinarum NRC-1]MCF2166322.1 hypothetical protein [Halobacterium salinarum]MCF2168809.1 hypothetical protein [Halobacterium salinarum]QRY23312.1 hypothetical protein JT689_04600 [Halobacterium sp. GSL-19]
MPYVYIPHALCMYCRHPNWRSRTMSTESNDTSETAFEFSLPEQWALHSAVRSHTKDALDESSRLPYPAVELAILGRIEDGEFTFTAFECRRLAALLSQYATHDQTPRIDHDPARAIAGQLRDHCQPPRHR